MKNKFICLVCISFLIDTVLTLTALHRSSVSQTCSIVFSSGEHVGYSISRIISALNIFSHKASCMPSGMIIHGKTEIKSAKYEMRSQALICVNLGHRNAIPSGHSKCHSIYGSIRPPIMLQHTSAVMGSFKK